MRISEHMLQQSDVDVLLATLLASQESNAIQSGRKWSEVKIYDFARPDNMPSEIIRALEIINAIFARSLSGMFSAILGEPVQIEPLSAEQMTFRQFCNSIPEVTSVGAFNITGMDGVSLMELNPHLAWYLIDRGLGGHGEILDTIREFTTLEKGMLEDIFRRMLRELTKAWDSLSPLHFTLNEVINNPSTAHIAQPDDRMVVCSFGITLSSLTGMSYYAIPVSCLDFDRLLNSARNKEGDEGEELDSEQEHALVLGLLHDTQVRVRCCLRDIVMDIGELANLVEGDTIQFETFVEQDFEIRVGNNRRFYAQPVTVKDKLAIKIVGDYLEETHE